MLHESSRRGSTPFPAGVRISSRFRNADIAPVFAVTTKDMHRRVERARRTFPPNGTIWLCWPKKASGMASGLQARDTVMNHMLPLGLVDVKVAAISDIRSGLKFVVRKDLR